MRYPTSSKQCPLSASPSSTLLPLLHSSPLPSTLALCCWLPTVLFIDLLPSSSSSSPSPFFAVHNSFYVFRQPSLPPLLMQIRSCPHFPWLLCCFTAKNYVLFVRGKKEKRGRGPGWFCVGQFGSVRFGCLLSIIWLIFHIRQNLFAVLAIYMGDTPCAINHRLANLVYDVERWRKEK